MNIPLLIAGVLTIAAFLTHTFVGTKETMQIAPKHKAGERTNVETAGRHWVQAMCAFQMVTADLLILSALLILVAVTDLIEHESIIILVTGSFFVLYLIFWLTTLIMLKQKRTEYLFLGQWILWLVNAGLGDSKPIPIVDGNHFINFNENKGIKIAWNFSLSEMDAGRTKVSTETRVQCLGKGMKRRFAVYWFFIRPLFATFRIDIFVHCLLFL